MSSFDMMMTAFDSHLDEGNKPLWTIDIHNDEELLKLLNAQVKYLQKLNQTRFSKMRQNLRLYKNERLVASRRTTESRVNDEAPLPRNIRFTVNHLFENTESKVNFMGRLKPAVEILPTNDEVKDKYAARLAKQFHQHLWDLNNIDYMTQQMHRHKYILGESYLRVLWNPEKGDLHPLYVKARDAGLIFPTDKPSTELINENGVLREIPAKRKVGDVDYKIRFPWRILLDPKESWEEVEYLYEIESKSVYELKRDYPMVAEKLKSNQKMMLFNANTLNDEKVNNQCIVYELWYKETVDFPKGLHIKFTEDCILSKKELGYDHGKLPYLRVTDLDVPGALNGTSFYEQAAPVQIMMNNLYSIGAKSLLLGAHPKWIMQQGSANIESLANENTVVQFKGQIAPRLETYNPMSKDVLIFNSGLKGELRELSSQPTITRGENPQGVTRAQALMFLNEQANERNSTDIAKHNNLVKEIAQMGLAVAGQFYKAEDGRTLRILGENGEYLIPTLDTSVLAKNYDIRINIGSALPDTKTAKTQKILEIMQYKEDLLPAERWIDLLDLGGTEKMQSLVTAALDAAESESEDMLDGKEVGEPKEWEDHIIHWQTHVKSMQRREYKERIDDESVNQFNHHLEMTEMLMFLKAQENPLFMSKVAALQNYPIFFKVPPGSIISAEQAQMQNQLAIQQGVPTNAQVPATEPQLQ